MLAIIPPLALDTQFAACRAVMNQGGSSTGDKQVLLNGIRADRDLLERLQRGPELRMRIWAPPC